MSDMNLLQLCITVFILLYMASHISAPGSTATPPPGYSVCTAQGQPTCVCQYTVKEKILINLTE